MRILDRYIVREIFRHAFLGLIVFTFVLFVPQLVRLMELLVRHSGSGAQILRLFLYIFPGVLMHVSFGAGYPDVLRMQIPAYWMIAGLGIKPLTVAYLIVLFGSLFDVGLGFIQSVNERIDGWMLERRGRPIERRTRAAIAFLCVLASGSLSLVGIVPLIAQGYSTMAWGFLLLFVGPLLSIGVYRLLEHPS